MLSSKPLIESHPLVEELIAGKQDLGAEYRFEPNTLEVKLNQYGVNGVFTRHKLSAGTEIISVPELSGSLTPFRAYEEAQEMLQKLGPDRFNVKDVFVVACAMYLRCTNSETKYSDILITEPDLKSAYYGSPVTGYGSLDLTMLLADNNRVYLDLAIKMDEYIKKMRVDPDLFRAMLGYTASRYWHGFGLIPVLDRFNSSYGNGANCEFSTQNGRLTYALLKDVDAGEELVWQYNNADAVVTWLNYGYVDDERPTSAFLELCVSKEEKVALEDFAVEKLHWVRNEISPNYKIDDCKFSLTLLNTGKLQTPALIRNSIAESLQHFVSVRHWFRVFILSGGQYSCDAITAAKLESDEPILGVDFEQKVVACMRGALKNGLIEGRKRVERFAVSEVGRSIDITPYNEMMEGASAVWEEVLVVIEAICSAQNIDECIVAINGALGLNIQSKDEIKPALEKVDMERPALAASLIQKYMQARI